MKRSIKILIASGITLLVAIVGFYFVLPAINIYSQEFWIAVLAMIIVWSVSYGLLEISIKRSALF